MVVNGKVSINTELEDSLKTIDDIQALKEDWNGYRAKPIPLEVVQISREIVGVLSKQPIICPTARRTIQMQYELADGSYLEFEIYGDHIHVLTVPQRIYDKAQETDVPAQNFTELKNLVTKFFEGECVNGRNYGAGNNVPRREVA